MLKGTLEGLERYLSFKYKQRLWTWRAILNNLTFKSKKWKSNIFDHVDYSYASLWDKTEYPFIAEEYRKIQLGEILPDQITRKIERYYNDQTVYYESTYRRFEPVEVRRTIDQLTDEYITWLMQVHIGRTFQTMNHISIGTSSQTPSRTDTGLIAESLRYHILDNGGYIDFLGHNELYGVIFAFTIGSLNVAESGLHNTSSPTTDITASRNVFSPALVHTVNSDAVGINIVIQHRGF